MRSNRIPTIAWVESRSEGRGEERPVAVVFAGNRFEILDVLERAVITTAVAGNPVRHRLWVELDDGRRCELRRTLPDGEWRVYVEPESSTDTEKERV